MDSETPHGQDEEKVKNIGFNVKTTNLIDSDNNVSKNTDLLQEEDVKRDKNFEDESAERNRLPQNTDDNDETMTNNRDFARAIFGVKLKPTQKSPSVTSKSSVGQNFSNFLFGPRKQVNNSAKTKYFQPEKVDKIDADPKALYPMDFVLKLQSGKSRHQRGYMEKVEPLPFDRTRPEDYTRFVCVSDTHNEHNRIELPEGDVLLHCGDFTLAGRIREVDNFNDWLGEVPFEHKIVIAGNHELSFDSKIMREVQNSKAGSAFSPWTSHLSPILEKGVQSMSSRLTNCTYLEDSEVNINGVRIWGSPWQPEFGGWGFNVPRGKEILKKWNKIPGEFPPGYNIL